MDLLADMQIVNVSSVAHCSPFRYPGGKTWLVPYFCEWMQNLTPRPRSLVEPFAGGAAISLAAASRKLVDRVVYGELDEAIAAVWETILGDKANDLIHAIRHFDFNPANVAKILEGEPSDTLGLAWQTLLRNRVQRGGIMAPGAGKIKVGDNSRGLGARWYPATLARRIQSIALLRSRLSFIKGNAFDLISRFQADPTAAFYIDPPYLVAAKRLYRHWEIDHRALFALVAKCRGPALLSYDDAPEIRGLAEKFKFTLQTAEMKNTHHTRQRELLLFKPAQP